MNITVVGAGIAGLAVSCRLAAKGHQVTVIEKNEFIGGKCSTIQNNGFRFDRGPSLFTMPHYLEEVFASCGKKMVDYFDYVEHPNACKYFWEDKTVVSAPSKPKEFAQALEQYLQIDKKKVDNYLKKSIYKFKLTEAIFLNKSLHKLKSYSFMSTLKTIFGSLRLDIFKTLNNLNNTLNNEKASNIFNRFATYNGSNPYESSAILSLIPALEHHYGTFFPKKGMHSIPDSLYSLAKEMGVKFLLNTTVTGIVKTNKQVTQVNHSKGFCLQEELIWASDSYNFYDLLQEKYPISNYDKKLSSSAGVFYWGIEGLHENIDLHNIFFSKDYKKEFEEIFSGEIPNDPTVYIHTATKIVKDDAPRNKESWFVMVNLPPGVTLSLEQRGALKEKIITKIKSCTGIDLTNKIISEDTFFPQDIERITGSYQGALYGLNSNKWYSSFERHPNFHKKYKNVKFCGGTVHPGGGIPLCLKSAKIVSNFYETA